MSARATVYAIALSVTTATTGGPLVAINEAYASVPEYRAIVGKSDTADDLLIGRHLLTCSRLFDRETGQFYSKDAEPVARIFVPKWGDVLDLDYEGLCPGIADITDLSIKVDTDGDDSFADETAWALTDYDLYPLNANKGPEPRPWDRIKPRGSKRFVPDNKVQITAIFGWPAVPGAVRDDVIELCGIWRSENPRATGRMGELDQVVATSPVALSLVKRIKVAYTTTKVTF